MVDFFHRPRRERAKRVDFDVFPPRSAGEIQMTTLNLKNAIDKLQNVCQTNVQVNIADSVRHAKQAKHGMGCDAPRVGHCDAFLS